MPLPTYFEEKQFLNATSNFSVLLWMWLKVHAHTWTIAIHCFGVGKIVAVFVRFVNRLNEIWLTWNQQRKVKAYAPSHSLNEGHSNISISLIIWNILEFIGIWQYLWAYAAKKRKYGKCLEFADFFFLYFFIWRIILKGKYNFDEKYKMNRGMWTWSGNVKEQSIETNVEKSVNGLLISSSFRQTFNRRETVVDMPSTST